jgi:LysR family transcriptional regulator, chromosome initiation inhibitor
MQVEYNSIMNFDTKQLAAFASVAAHGSFTAAALELNLSLSAVSLRVKALEAILGQRLLTRAKTVRPTPVGLTLLTHIQQMRLLQADFLERFRPTGVGRTSIALAVNADSLASWFIPGVHQQLQASGLLLDIHIDDQEHTLQLLTEGAVVGCLTAQSKAAPGCVARPLGVMRYRCIAAKQLADRMRQETSAKSKAVKAISVHDLLRTNAVCFNRKDRLQDQFIEQHFAIRNAPYQRHYVSAVDGFHEALMSGLGWGLESTIQYRGDFNAKKLVDLFPGKHIDVPLYWQHYAREGAKAAQLTTAIEKAASKYLL